MNEKTLYEFSVPRERENWVYSDKIYVLAVNKTEAMLKFLDEYPELYDFRITNWWGVDIL